MKIRENRELFFLLSISRFFSWIFHSKSISYLYRNGVIHNYDPKTCRGMIKDASSSNLTTFNEKDGCHVKGDQVSYDLINGIVYNVTKTESQVTKKRKLKKPKKDKTAKKSKKLEKKKSVTKCLCILDIQTISIHGHDPQISQIGAIILNNENEVATFNR